MLFLAALIIVAIVHAVPGLIYTWADTLRKYFARKDHLGYRSATILAANAAACGVFASAILLLVFWLLGWYGWFAFHLLFFATWSYLLMDALDDDWFNRQRRRLADNLKERGKHLVDQSSTRSH